MSPLVSVITPTWKRHDLLLNRCVPSVEDQTFLVFEHVVVSDGPDEELADLLPDHVSYDYLPEHVPGHIGNPARLRALEIAHGEYIAYLDDDDAYRPEHVALHVAALEADPEVGFSRSIMASHNPSGLLPIGYGEPGPGNVGTPMIVHRKELLDIATWRDGFSEYEDWELVQSWIHAGVKWTAIDEITIDVWPSIYHGGRP